MPPIDIGLTQRKGYRAISDDTELPPDTPGTAESMALVEQMSSNELQSNERGWSPLIWSFAASSALTVLPNITR